MIRGGTLTIHSQVLSLGSHPILFRALQWLTSLFSSYPNPFSCAFIPRDERARELVLADMMAH
jgi:hypothetical protein